MAGELGDWTLKFTVDATGIAEATSGVQQLESAIEETTNKSVGFGKELSSIKKDIKGLGSDFIMLGAAAGGAIGGLAAMAPSLAGNFANISIAMRNLGEAFAPHIAPILDGIANSLNGLADWVNQNPEAAGWITNMLAAVTGLGAASLVFNIADRAWSVLSGLWETGIKIKDLAEPILKGLWETGMTLAKGAWDLISGGLKFAADALSSLSATIITAFSSSSIGVGLASAVGSTAGGGLLGYLAGAGSAATGGAIGMGSGAAVLGGAVITAIGTAVAFGIKEVSERSGFESALGGGWYEYGKQGQEKLEYRTSGQNFMAGLSQWLFGGDSATKIGPTDMGFKGAEAEVMRRTTINMPITVQGTVVSESYLSDLVARLFRMAQNQYG